MFIDEQHEKVNPYLCFDVFNHTRILGRSSFRERLRMQGKLYPQWVLDR
jgi:hypothetical protein